MEQDAEIVDVLIVGAGLSGLVCARELQASCRVAVLEARDRTGGRLLSTPGGADLGGSWSWPSQEPRLASLAAELGVASVPQRLDGEALVGEGPGAARHAGPVGERLSLCGPGAIRFKGGMARIAEVLASSLPPHVIRLGCRVVALECAGGGGPGRVRATYEQAGAGVRSIRAARAVLALPPGVTSASIRISPPLPDAQQKQMAATPTWAGDWAKVVATFRSPFWRARGESGIAATPGLKVADAWWEAESGPDLGEDACALAGVAFGARCKRLAQCGYEADGSSCTELRALVEADLNELFGAAAVDQLVAVHHKCWMADPLTHAEVRPHAHGKDPRRLYGHELLRQPTDWGLHFAGTESESEAGHVEGAVKAGERVAQEIRSACVSSK